jgi:hypothetical protein
MGVSICGVEFSSLQVTGVSRASTGDPKHSFRLFIKHRRIVVELGAKWTICKNHQLSSEASPTLVFAKLWNQHCFSQTALLYTEVARLYLNNVNFIR